MNNYNRFYLYLLSLILLIPNLAAPAVPPDLNDPAVLPELPPATESEVQTRAQMRIQWHNLKSSEYTDRVALIQTTTAAVRIINGHGEDPEALKVLSDLHYRSVEKGSDKLLADAEELLGRYLAVAKHDLEYRRRYADTLVLSRKFEKAKEQAGLLILAEPKNYEHYTLKALCHAALGEKDSMENAILKATSLFPNNPKLAEFRAGLNKLLEAQKDPGFVKIK